MVHHATFWTYKAGTRVLSADGRRVGAVSAVRRDAVLVSRVDGECSWIRGDDVLSYDGVTLTVKPTIAVGAKLASMDVVISVDYSTSWCMVGSLNSQSFDA